MSDSCAVAIGRGAEAIRRRLGPRTWFVFEELVLDADAQLHCILNAREIAQALGMSKDTAARALADLVDAGLVDRVVRRDDGGRYRGTRLIVQLPVGVQRITVSDYAGQGSDRRRTTASPKARRGRQPSQLSLIGGDDG